MVHATLKNHQSWYAIDSWIRVLSYLRITRDSDPTLVYIAFTVLSIKQCEIWGHPQLIWQQYWSHAHLKSSSRDVDTTIVVIVVSYTWLAPFNFLLKFVVGLMCATWWDDNKLSLADHQHTKIEQRTTAAAMHTQHFGLQPQQSLLNELMWVKKVLK